MKELEAAKTKIGEKVGSYKGRYTIFSVFYGNYVSPTIDGEFVHLKEDEYENILNDFFVSEEGQEYRRPEAEEIKKASMMVLNSEIMYLKEKEDGKIDLEILEEKKEASASEKTAKTENKKVKTFSILVMVFVLLETALSIFFIMT